MAVEDGGVGPSGGDRVRRGGCGSLFRGAGLHLLGTHAKEVATESEAESGLRSGSGRSWATAGEWAGWAAVDEKGEGEKKRRSGPERRGLGPGKNPSPFISPRLQFFLLIPFKF